MQASLCGPSFPTKSATMGMFCFASGKLLDPFKARAAPAAAPSAHCGDRDTRLNNP